MAGRASAHRIKTHQIYSVWEAANALGKHRQTVIRWIKTGGLVADTTQKPWLIRYEPPCGFWSPPATWPTQLDL